MRREGRREGCPLFLRWAGKTYTKIHSLSSSFSPYFPHVRSCIFLGHLLIVKIDFAIWEWIFFPRKTLCVCASFYIIPFLPNYLSFLFLFINDKVIAKNFLSLGLVTPAAKKEESEVSSRRSQGRVTFLVTFISCDELFSFSRNLLFHVQRWFMRSLIVIRKLLFSKLC